MRREDLLTPELVRELQAHALRAYPHEAIGIVTTHGYKRLPNISDRPEAMASVPLRLIAPYIEEGSLLATFHSHPDGPNCPSALDMQSQIAMAVPSIICTTNGEACLPPFAWGDQLEPLPLLDRTFQHAVTDCYELIRDHRLLTFGERLPQFPRDWNWWLSGKRLYLDGFAQAGYRRLDDHEPRMVGDVIIMSIRSPHTPNHAGVLVEDGRMLHHASAKDPYDPTRLSKRHPVVKWQKHIDFWIRRDAP